MYTSIARMCLEVGGGGGEYQKTRMIIVPGHLVSSFKNVTTSLARALADRKVYHVYNACMNKLTY